MRLFVVFLACCAGLLAQQRGGARAGAVARPTASARPSVGTTGSLQPRVGGPRTGRPAGFAAPYVPYGYTVIYPGFIGGYANPLGPVYTPAPGTYDSIFGVNGAPIAVVNPGFQTDSVQPQVMDYSNVPLPPPGPAYNPQASFSQEGFPQQSFPQQSQPEPALGSTINGEIPLILIAMKDHTINPALAYWIQGDAINYVIPGGAVNRAPLSQVDRELSLKLNADRRPDFKLP